MQVAEDPYLAFIFLFDLLHQLFDAAHFRMVLWLRVDPLAIEVDAGRRISVITANHTIRIHARYEYESVEAAQVFSFAGIRRDKIVDATEHLRAGRLT